MTRHIPLVPFVSISASIAAIFGAIWLIDSRPTSSINLDLETSVEFLEIGDSSPQASYNDPVRLNGDLQIILSQSPFSKSRTAFTRVLAMDESQNAAPSVVALDPRILGVVENERSLRALVIWRPGEDVNEIEIGDNTPLGQVVAITSNEVQFAKDGSERTLSLF